MHTAKFFRLLPGFFLALAACGTADDPYSKFKDPPLVQARLHTVTLASDTPAIAEALLAAGYQAAPLPPNYQQADAVQAGLWGVPEPVAAAATHFTSTTPGRPDIRVLVLPLAARGRAAGEPADASFFRHVLASDVPSWPLPSSQPENVRIQVWTYLVPDILVASRRFRENGIPVVYDPVGITTAYLGDHRTLATRAPDGTVVQLVQTAAQ
jgi:hypothetical protein